MQMEPQSNMAAIDSTISSPVHIPPWWIGNGHVATKSTNRFSASQENARPAGVDSGVGHDGRRNSQCDHIDEIMRSQKLFLPSDSSNMAQNQNTTTQERTRSAMLATRQEKRRLQSLLSYGRVTPLEAAAIEAEAVKLANTSNASELSVASTYRTTNQSLPRPVTTTSRRELLQSRSILQREDGAATAAMAEAQHSRRRQYFASTNRDNELWWTTHERLLRIRESAAASREATVNATEAAALAAGRGVASKTWLTGAHRRRNSGTITDPNMVPHTERIHARKRPQSVSAGQQTRHGVSNISSSNQNVTNSNQHEMKPNTSISPTTVFAPTATTTRQPVNRPKQVGRRWTTQLLEHRARYLQND